MKFKNKTSGGFPVRILATDIDSCYTIAAAITLGDGQETVYMYEDDGINRFDPRLSLVPDTFVKKYQVLFQLPHKQGVAMAVSNTYFESMDAYYATGMPFSKYNRLLLETVKWSEGQDKTEKDGGGDAPGNKYTPIYQVLYATSYKRNGDSGVHMETSSDRYRSMEEFYLKTSRIPNSFDKLLEDTAVFYDEQGNAVG